MKISQIRDAKEKEKKLWFRREMWYFGTSLIPGTYYKIVSLCIGFCSSSPPLPLKSNRRVCGDVGTALILVVPDTVRSERGKNRKRTLLGV